MTKPTASKYTKPQGAQTMKLQAAITAVLASIGASLALVTPVLAAPALASKTVIADNTLWAGYEQPSASGGAYTGVAGTFTVPVTPSPMGTQSDVAAWIGLVGRTAGDLLQVGVITTGNDGGQPEAIMFNGAASPWSFGLDNPGVTVNPGDTLQASIAVDTGLGGGPCTLITSNGQTVAAITWTLTLADITTGQTGGDLACYPPDQATGAAWAVEGDGFGLTLSPFQPVAFTNISSTGQTGSSLSRDVLVAHDNVTPLTSVSPFADGGFVVSYVPPAGTRPTSATTVRKHGARPRVTVVSATQTVGHRRFRAQIVGKTMRLREGATEVTITGRVSGTRPWITLTVDSTSGGTGMLPSPVDARTVKTSETGMFTVVVRVRGSGHIQITGRGVTTTLAVEPLKQRSQP